MADRSDFDGFVASRSHALLRTAYLLTGDHALAEDLLQTALAKSWFAWGRISGAPEPYVRRVPGYTAVRTARDFVGPQEHLVAGYGVVRSRILIMARCPRPGTGTVRNTNINGPRFDVDCSRRVGDHFEGLTVLDPGQGAALLKDNSRGDPDLWIGPGSDGDWVIAILQANAPESLPPHTDRGSPLLADGMRTPSGATVQITIPPARVPEAGERIEIAMGFTTDCVAGVRLTFTVPTGELGTADCDPLGRQMTEGKVATYVTKRQLAALGLRPGQRVAVTIRSVGRDTDQWRVYPPN